MNGAGTKKQLVELNFQFTACEILCVNEFILFLSEKEKAIESTITKEATFLWICILQCKIEYIETHTRHFELRYKHLLGFVITCS